MAIVLATGTPVSAAAKPKSECQGILLNIQVHAPGPCGGTTELRLGIYVHVQFTHHGFCHWERQHNISIPVENPTAA